MGKIISNFLVSLDGVVEAPDQWHFPYFDDEMGAVIGRRPGDEGGLLDGPHAVDEWSEYWPASTDEPIATIFNETPKYVISSSLANPTWNNTTVVAGDVDAVRRLRKQVDGDIVMSGARRQSGGSWPTDSSTSSGFSCTRLRSVMVSASSRTRRPRSCNWSTARRCPPVCST